MTSTTYIIGILIWAVCGFLAYGLTVYQFQMNWPEERRADRLPKHRKFGLIMAAIGPFGLFPPLADCLIEWRIGFKL